MKRITAAMFPAQRRVPLVAGAVLLAIVAGMLAPAHAVDQDTPIGPPPAPTVDQPTTSAESEPLSVQRLRGQGAKYWSGAFTRLPPSQNRYPGVASQGPRPPVELCGVAYECHDYIVRIKDNSEAGSRLRVGLTFWPGIDSEDLAELVVLPPGGQASDRKECRGAITSGGVAGQSVRVGYPWSFEAVIGDGQEGGCGQQPQAGDYLVRVLGVHVRQDARLNDKAPYAPYQLRALVQHPVKQATGRELLPDLMVPSPPWDFGFECRRFDSPREETSSNTTGERVCLRYAFAYGNNGDGILDLRFTPRIGEDQVPITQHVYQHDSTPGRYEDNQANTVYQGVGAAHFHASHRHWHVTDAYQAQLLEIAEDGQLTEWGRAAKAGICTSGWFMVDFDRIFHDEVDVPDSGCEAAAAGERPQVENVRIPLPAGWGDYYPADTADNFVDLTGALQPGESKEYVLRYRLNPLALDNQGGIHEKDLSNNTAYAHIHVTRDNEGQHDVCVVERGFGSDPWAANATPVEPALAEYCSPPVT